MNPTAASPYPELQQLRDIQLPEAVGSWPPSIPLTLLLILLSVLLLAGALWGVQRYRQGALKRVALAEWQRIKDQQQLSPYEQVDALAQLLRRVCLSRYSHHEIAPLTGKAWLTFLDHCYDPTGRANLFREGPGQAIESKRFESKRFDSDAALSNTQSQALIELVHQWIKKTC